MTDLQLKDICGYLPYGMYAKIGNSIDIIYQIERNPVEPISRIGIGSHNEVLISKIKPILRPISDLTKTVKHKGEDIIPLVELANGFNKPDKYRMLSNGLAACDGRAFGVNIKTMTCEDWAIPYTLKRNRYYDSIRFHDKLNELMFDYRGLIEKGLAIDINTLKKNPYE